MLRTALVRTPTARPRHRKLRALQARLGWLPGPSAPLLPPRWPTACARPSEPSAVRLQEQSGTLRTRAGATAAQPRATNDRQLRSPGRPGDRGFPDEALGSGAPCAGGQRPTPRHRPDRNCTWAVRQCLKATQAWHPHTMASRRRVADHRPRHPAGGRLWLAPRGPCHASSAVARRAPQLHVEPAAMLARGALRGDPANPCESKLPGGRPSGPACGHSASQDIFVSQGRVTCAGGA